MLRASITGLRFDNLRGDFYGGVTAAVVALPLALAFGVASGARPVAGVYGAIFVGLLAALFGGTPSQISGPMSFGAANEMARKLSAQVAFEMLILDLSEVPMIDSSASLAVEEVIERALAAQRQVLLVGLNPRVERVLMKLGVLDHVAPDARFPERLSALHHAAATLGVVEVEAPGIK